MTSRFLEEPSTQTGRKMNNLRPVGVKHNWRLEMFFEKCFLIRACAFTIRCVKSCQSTCLRIGFFSSQDSDKSPESLLDDCTPLVSDESHGREVWRSDHHSGGTEIRNRKTWSIHGLKCLLLYLVPKRVKIGLKGLVHSFLCLYMTFDIFS